MIAPKGAQALTHVLGRRDGINELTFVVGDHQRVMVEVLSTQPDAVVKMWQMLDGLMDEIYDGEQVGVEVAKLRARSVAACISLCMPKHYPDVDSVAKEARQRYESGDAEGNVTRITPGLADDELKPYAPKIVTKLDPQQITFIKNATDVIPVPELATMFKVSEAEIHSVL